MVFICKNTEKFRNTPPLKTEEMGIDVKIFNAGKLL